MSRTENFIWWLSLFSGIFTTLFLAYVIFKDETTNFTNFSYLGDAISLSALFSSLPLIVFLFIKIKFRHRMTNYFIVTALSIVLIFTGGSGLPFLRPQDGSLLFAFIILSRANILTNMAGLYIKVRQTKGAFLANREIIYFPFISLIILGLIALASSSGFKEFAAYGVFILVAFLQIPIHIFLVWLKIRKYRINETNRTKLALRETFLYIISALAYFSLFVPSA